jgi:hypothetical protein
MVALTHALSRLMHIEHAVTRIPFEKVRVVGNHIEVDLDAESTNALRTERWLDDHVICRIPGGAAPEQK